MVPLNDRFRAVVKRLLNDIKEVILRLNGKFYEGTLARASPKPRVSILNL